MVPVELAAFKRPKVSIIVDHLPRNAMGKVQKAELRNDADIFRKGRTRSCAKDRAVAHNPNTTGGKGCDIRQRILPKFSKNQAYAKIKFIQTIDSW